MSKATEDDLNELHGEIARGLTEVVRNGVVVAVKEDGEEVRTHAPAAYFMAGITMLKNNNITASPSKNAALGDLADALAARRRSSKTKLNTGMQAIQDAQDQLDHMLGTQLQ